MKKLPRKGRSSSEVLSTMQELKEADVQWEDGRVWCLVFHAGDEISQFLKEAYTTYFSENALNPTAFPSLKRMETEVVSMAANLLGGDEYTCGNLTTGGTESILMAVKTAREWGREKGITKPQMVIPVSAHPAFQKAAHYFDVEIVLAPVGKDFRADVRAMKKLINRRTVLLVGSAPQYPQGVVDPIEDIAHLAQKKGILCHVDACVGGLMLPFVRALKYDVPPFDFSVPGVTSMSADLHKYGYAAKGASVVLYRNPELRKHQYFAYTDWPGGIYVSPTMTGTRPGGAIAAAWAIMHRLGFDGYLEITRRVMDVTTKLREGINAIDGLEILGRPHMSVMCIGSTRPDIDIYEVGDNMSERGWHLDRQQSPNTLHLTINQAHIQAADAFLKDLNECVVQARMNFDAEAAKKEKLKNSVMRGLLKVLPAPVASKATELGVSMMGMGDGLPTRTAAMYGMMAALPNRGDLNTIVIDLLDKMTRFEPGTKPILPDQE
jgi:glutamate/tyrosine decarboxylase-like PLP-dependent enzyme